MSMNLEEMRVHLMAQHGMDPLTVTGKCFGIQSVPAPTLAELEQLHDRQPHHEHKEDVGEVVYTVTTNGQGRIYLVNDLGVQATRDLEIDVADEAVHFADQVRKMIIEVEEKAL